MSKPLEFNGATYHVGYSVAMAPLSDDEFKNLEKSIKDDGMKAPILVVPLRPVMQDGTLGPIVKNEFNMVDGMNRMRLAHKLKLDPVKVPITVLDPDTPVKECQRMALTLNLARRHLTPKKKTEAIKQLKAMGMSYRDIAATVGVGRSTAHRQATGVNGKGKGSGKKPAAPADDAPVAPPPDTDQVGVTLPSDKLKDVFAARSAFIGICLALKNAKDRVGDLGALESKAGACLNVGETAKAIASVADAVEAARPFAVCPSCLGKAKGCETCKGRGWVSQAQYRTLPKELQESHQRLAKEQADEARKVGSK